MSDARSQRTVIFAGGGTGGHLFPGIAVARELLNCEPESRVLFIGSEKPIERDILRNAGLEHVALPSLSPSLSPIRIGQSLVQNWRAYRRARAIIVREQPAAVVGLGGFASVAPVLAAKRLGLPIVLLEQNVIPGKATRWLSRLADVVCLPWAETAKHFSPRIKTVITGNPIRREIAELAKMARPENKHDAPASELKTAADRPVLLILGGSQGATSMNGAVVEAVASLRSEFVSGGWRIVHQTGAVDRDAIHRRYAALALHADVQPFLSDMVGEYRQATCVISRAGATTLAELACAGLPSLLIPLPTSAHDHQRLNARLFADRSAALLFDSTAAAGETLGKLLVPLLTDASLRNRLRHNLHDLATPEAASLVLAVIRQHAVASSDAQRGRN